MAAKIVRMGHFCSWTLRSWSFCLRHPVYFPLTWELCSQNQKQESDSREGDGSLISRVREYFCADGW